MTTLIPGGPCTGVRLVAFAIYVTNRVLTRSSKHRAASSTFYGN